MTNLLISCAIVPAAFVVGSGWGLVGVSLAWTLAYPAAFFIAVVRAGRVIGVSPREFFGAMRRALTMSAGMYAGVAGMRAVLPEAMGDVYSLSILVGTGVFVYTVLSLSLNRRESREAMALLRGQ